MRAVASRTRSIKPAACVVLGVLAAAACSDHAVGLDAARPHDARAPGFDADPPRDATSRADVLDARSPPSSELPAHATGIWYSTWYSTAAHYLWIRGHGVGSTQQLLADVDGDGRADAVVFIAGGGDWYVARSNGNGFDGYAPWIHGHGIGATQRLLADVTGDGRADAVAFFARGGTWYVAPSTGTAFAPYGPPASGHGAGSSAQLLADTDGDHHADAVVFDPDGTWHVAAGGAAGFTVPAASTVWAYEHGAVGANGHGAHADAALLGDVFGTGRAAPVIFTAADGSWRALDTTRFYKPNMQHTWEAWNIGFRPRTHGAYQVYDSGDASVIDEHLAAIEAARIDFLLFDETNSIDVDGGYIRDRAVAICRRIAVRRATDPAAPTFAIAIGAVQYTHDPASIEAEAAEVWSRFVTSAECGGASNTTQLEGRPLLVVYAEQADRARWQSWSGDKSASARFTVRWAQGILATSGVSGCDFPGGMYPGGPVATADRGLYYGWGVLHGALPDATNMVVMPGWNNHRGCFVPRADGAFYRAMGWDSVIANAPAISVINSYNEYAEETAVAPTDTSLVSGSTEAWSDPDLYWNLTSSYALRRKM